MFHPIKLLASTFLFLFILTSCHWPVKPVETGMQQGSILSLYESAINLAHARYPKAIWIGFNNHGPSLDRLDFVPTEPDTTGSTGYWFFIFAKSPKALSDRMISSSDTFGVLFQKGTLSLTEQITSKPIDLVNLKDPSTPLIRMDSTQILSHVLSRIRQDQGAPMIVKHVDFNCIPGRCEITVFKNLSEGVNTSMDPVTGEIFDTKAISFVRTPLKS